MASQDGRIHVRWRKPKLPTLRELVAQITPENRFEEAALGTEAGRERVEWSVARPLGRRHAPSLP